MENGISWNTLRAETYPWTESNYGGTRMYYDFHDRDGSHPASKPFADWGGEHDGEFVKAVVDWLQTMTAAQRGVKPEPAAEWLMGFPIGWTETGASETQSCPKLPNGSADD